MEGRPSSGGVGVMAAAEGMGGSIATGHAGIGYFNQSGHVKSKE